MVLIFLARVRARFAGQPLLQRGGDIRQVTLGQLANHTSGLPRVPQQYEHWHRGGYMWPDFVRFLNSWKAGPNQLRPVFGYWIVQAELADFVARSPPTQQYSKVSVTFSIALLIICS